MAEILVLVAHPDLQHSRVNRRLMQAAADAAPARTELRDLYALYPDYWIDVAAEQAQLAQARLVVWQHPLHWYGPTPLMKLWMDAVLAFGWAYGPGGQALAGKHLWPVLSTGGTAASYTPQGSNRHAFAAFLPPYAQTAALTGMALLEPLVVHGAHRLDAAALEAHAQRYADALVQYPRWPGPGGADGAAPPTVPADERPATPAA